ncbi:MAG: type I DNA topoisomerase [Candidatus Pacebacteria bacterium]|nr:type I DNA topoisomerase [Candidatus Paceibacterota bacterium]MDD5445718.1 type I DNA topoisomerase [Candidatus Paceibacterota bacterium]
MPLIIVESPTKSKTIKGFLKNYEVTSSFGHIRDLPKSKLGIDIENNFTPQYIIPLKAKKIVKELKEKMKKTDYVILASDEDREGEAIAWHLKEALKLENPKRIVFHEITKEAIKKALESPREINMDLVNSQQARRVLDRLVGYKLSPFLWKKISKGLSAGRVQSVILRLVVEREREIEKFVPQEYWQIESFFEKDNKEFSAFLFKEKNRIIEKLEIKTKEEAEKILKVLENENYIVSKIEKKETKRKPLPPFMTSTLQQEAFKKIGLSTKATMSIAQKLYENGLITYHRSDSLNLSEQSLLMAKDFIEKNFGKNYHSLRRYKAKKGQEAHEAIRPTSIEKTPQIKEKTDIRIEKLYSLIWQRFMASQMSEAFFDSTSIEIKAKEYTFKTSGQTLKFDGFLKVYPVKFEEKELPILEKEEILKLIKVIPSQHFTLPPPRFNEASLVKTLEEYGIGRPSTYAPTISTVQERNYILKNEQKKFEPTEIGITVNDILTEHFPEIVDFKFTANMEESLDKIAKGEKSWEKVCNDFYVPFEKNLKTKYEEVAKKEAIEEETDKICPKCNSPIVLKTGRYGKFYACSNFPSCKHTENIEKKSLGVKCPECKEGDIVEKITRKRKIFYACNRYPDCKFALWDKPINEKCPKCDSLLVEKNKKTIKCSNKDCNFEKKMTE